jgi:hypothetical protein
MVRKYFNASYTSVVFIFVKLNILKQCEIIDILVNK